MENTQLNNITSIYMSEDGISFNKVTDYHLWPDIKCTRRAIGIAQFLDKLGLEGVRVAVLGKGQCDLDMFDIDTDPQSLEGQLVTQYLLMAKEGIMPPPIEDVIAILKSEVKE
jgi:hypothetical protein